MKNKKLRYILIPAVVIIWGLVLYKVFSYTDDTPEFNFNSNIDNEILQNNSVVDTFSLIADYRDPFLGNQSTFKSYSPSIESSNNNTQNKSVEIKKTNNQQTVTNIRWPQVKYGGLVINQNSDKKVGIMQLNGKKHLIEENKDYDNITIQRIFEDSVLISYMNNSKTFYK